jgi:hypothetical protein
MVSEEVPRHLQTCRQFLNRMVARNQEIDQSQPSCIPKGRMHMGALFHLH